MNDTVEMTKKDYFGCIAIPPREPASDPDYIKHVHCEGARFHVKSWDSFGIRCSEKKCIINKAYNKRREDK